jgi:hypothetical protein
VERFGGTAGDFMNLDFSGWCGNPLLAAFESESREHEIIFPFPATRHLVLRIDLPPGHAVRHRPEDVAYEDEWFTYHRSCRGTGNSLVVERTLALTSARVDAVDYQTARGAVEDIRKHDRETIALKRAPR